MNSRPNVLARIATLALVVALPATSCGAPAPVGTAGPSAAAATPAAASVPPAPTTGAPELILEPPLAAPADAIEARVAVAADRPGATIARDFLGLSFEAPDLVGVRFDPSNAATLRLLSNLGGGTLRFGGSWVEDTYWSRSGRSGAPLGARATVIPSDLDQLFAFARRSGWGVIFGVNLGHYDPATFADEAAYAISAGGPQLRAIEVGNEPDLFMSNGLRPSTWSYADFRREFEGYLAAIRAASPGAAIAGPVTCCKPDWLTRSVQDDGADLALVVHHIYPMHNAPTVASTAPNYASLDNMLSPALARRQSDLIAAVGRAAAARGLPWRIAESNSASGGGKAGVTDVFGAALWATDYLFSLAQAGASGVNFHLGGGACGAYAPLCLRERSASVRPLYYAMLLFADAGRGRTVPVEVVSPANVTAYATASGSETKVVIVNKSLRQDVVARVTFPSRTTGARAVRLVGAGADSTADVSYAGAAVATDGAWRAARAEEVISRDGAFVVTLPRASAVVLTID